jgi:hypothetical protein
MRRTSILSLLCLGAVVHAADDVASDYWVRVMPAAWLVGFDGDARYSADGSSGDHLTLDDLDLGDTEAGFGIEVSAKLPILLSFHGGFYAVGTEGSFTAAGVQFGGETFNGSVDTSLDLADLYLEADLQLLDLDLVGCAIGLGWHRLDVEVDLAGGGTRATLDEEAQFPVVALRAHANLPVLTSLGAEAKVHWMELSLDDTAVSYLDATLQVTWRPWEYLGFIGGYRHVVVDLGFDAPAGVDADADVDVTLSGPFLGVTAQF